MADRKKVDDEWVPNSTSVTNADAVDARRNGSTHEASVIGVRDLCVNDQGHGRQRVVHQVAQRLAMPIGHHEERD